MRVRVDEHFLDEARRFRLHFTCESCAHHVRARDACAHGWPDHDHRRLPVLKAGEVVDVSFCKEFELC